MSEAAAHPAPEVNIAPAAALMADHARAAMLLALLDGRPLAATELSRLAAVSPPTASAHLAKLLDGGLVTVVRQGRHRYYRLAGHEVAEAIEALSRLGRRPRFAACGSPGGRPRSPRHGPVMTTWLAGPEWNCSTPCCVRACWLRPPGSARGSARTRPATPTVRLPTWPPCATGSPGAGWPCWHRSESISKTSWPRGASPGHAWTGRSAGAHLGGGLAAAITARLFELGWIERGPRVRSVRVTPDGQQKLATTFGWTEGPSGRELLNGRLAELLNCRRAGTAERAAKGRGPRRAG